LLAWLANRRSSVLMLSLSCSRFSESQTHHWGKYNLQFYYSLAHFLHFIGLIRYLLYFHSTQVTSFGDEDLFYDLMSNFLNLSPFFATSYFSIFFWSFTFPKSFFSNNTYFRSGLNYRSASFNQSQVKLSVRVFLRLISLPVLCPAPLALSVLCHRFGLAASVLTFLSSYSLLWQFCAIDYSKHQSWHFWAHSPHLFYYIHTLSQTYCTTLH